MFLAVSASVPLCTVAPILCLSVFLPNPITLLLTGYGPRPTILLNNSTVHYKSNMSSSYGKLLEFFVHIPKLEVDGSNWVIFKDRFLFAAAAAALKGHIDGTDVSPVMPVIAPTREPLTEIQTDKLTEYEKLRTKWDMEENILKQALASVIPDSLFIEVRRKETALAMWDAVKGQREKKSRMVTVDMRRKIQSEKCSEQGDVRTHLVKLQTMREDLASMGAAISDEDFTSVILGSIPQSYDTYIAAITATSSLLNQTLSPTNLIDAIRDESDRRAIKNPKPKKEGQDAAFAAGQSSDKGKKGNDESKKSKRVKCYNCKKLGHVVKECWAPGGGAEGKGPKQKDKGGKGKGKDTAAKIEEKKEDDDDGVWMAVVDGGDGIVDIFGAGDADGCEMWSKDEISMESDAWIGDVHQDDMMYSPDSSGSVLDDILASFDLEVEAGDEEEVGIEDLEKALAIDDGDEPTTHTFTAMTLADTGSARETELYDSGASRHMSPYKYKFFNFIAIQKRILTAADGGHFEAIGKGDMRISMPNGNISSKILLKDVLYAPKMGITLVSIGKIDLAGYAALFYGGQLRIFASLKEKKTLAQIPMKNGLYRVEHEKEEVAAAVIPEVVTVDKLHRLLGHVSPEAAKVMVKKEIVEGLTLDESSQMPTTCSSCEYGKAHRKPIKKERKAPRASKIGEEVHTDVWGPSPIRTIGGREYFSAYTDDYSRYSKLYLQRLKSETFASYKKYEAFLRRQRGAEIKKLHSDRRGEYLSKKFSDHLGEKGTVRNLTVHDTPEHNGVAERLNRTLLEKV